MNYLVSFANGLLVISLLDNHGVLIAEGGYELGGARRYTGVSRLKFLFTGSNELPPLFIALLAAIYRARHHVGVE